jgi:hypothetical protein
MKKEKMIKEIEALYFKEEGLLRVINGMNKTEKELKNKNAELLKENNSLKKELREAKQQIKALQHLQNTNIETSNNIDVQEFVQNSLQFLTKAMELSKMNIAGVLNK